MQRVLRGESIKIGKARLDILNPPADVYAEDNDNSVSFVLNYEGQAKALFLGDSSVKVEQEISVPDVEILMVGHHGSRTSTSAALLTAARPEYAVISYGRNFYGHPHPTVVERLEQSGVVIRETFLEGAVRLVLKP